MSEQQNFVLKKTTPNDVIFELHPISNIQLKKIVRLTARNPQVALPQDWALGVFFDAGVFALYKKGFFTFDNNEAIVKLATENGVYFDIVEFTPSTTNDVPEILAILKSGNRANILSAIDKFGKEKVRDVATTNIDSLTTGVVSMLESIFKVQLILDNN